MPDSRIVMAVLFLSLISCRTARWDQRQPIVVPPGLSAEEVGLAILADLTNQPLPKELTTGEAIADNAMKALFAWRYQSVNQPRDAWFPVSFEPGIIQAGFERGPHYLQAKIRYNEKEVTTGVSGSRNLRQSGHAIHKNAVAWLDHLDTRIQRVLGRLAASRQLPEPRR